MTLIRWNYSSIDWKCLRKDNLNLLQEFLKKPNSKYVENRGELLKDLRVNETDYLLGNKHSILNYLLTTLMVRISKIIR